MSKVKRFRWVFGNRSKVKHIKYGDGSEGPTACGVFARKGWSWQVGNMPAITLPVCKRCEAANDT